MKRRYLDLMSFKTADEAYREVKKLSSDLTDDQHLVRSCIFDLHAAVEIELRRIFYHTFKAQLFLTDNEAENEEVLASYSKRIERLSFTDMYRVLEPVLNSWPYPELADIKEVNLVRNRAAHGGDLKKVIYKDRSPFDDADCFAQMFFDVWAIRQSTAKVFDKTISAPKRTLKRYIDKYGPGEI